MSGGAVYRVVITHHPHEDEPHQWWAYIYAARSVGDDSAQRVLAGEYGATRADALERAAEWVRAETETNARPETVYLNKLGQELEL